jgi:hypothetical protein
LCREVHYELRQRRFSFSHIGPPKFLSWAKWCPRAS